ncbi:MAG: PEP/pyruvate-binding domain-containing protein, partial [Pseudomonadota bacterium]
ALGVPELRIRRVLTVDTESDVSARILKPDQATDPAIVGGKAAGLAGLAKAGLPPPPFFVVLGAGDVPSLEELAPFVAELGEGPFAVRSSAVGEDSTTLSHAGQFQTILNVAPADVPAAITRVLGSGGGVQSYRNAAGGVAAPLELNAIVQQMIQPRAAGIAFSADPVTGRRDRAIVSAVEGLGAPLVSGEVDGESFSIGPDREILEHSSGELLTPSEAAAVAALARQAEAWFGAPQDIEWAIDEAGLHILQSRPITTPLNDLPADDATFQIFDNSNIIESYPGVVSPLTYSFAVYIYSRVYRAFVRLLGVSELQIRANAVVFDNMLSRIDGRVYYNLVNWCRALSLLPGYSLNRGYMETMMGVSEPLPDEITRAIGPPTASGSQKFRDVLRLGRAGAGLIWQAMVLPRTRRRFVRRLDQALSGRCDLSTAPLTALAHEYRSIEGELLDRWDAPLINDFLCMIGFGASRALLERWLGKEGVQVHNDMMIGQGDIVSAEPPQRILRIARMVTEQGLAAALRKDGLAALDDAPAVRAEMHAYLDRFGDRCVQELKLESIPLLDDPAPLIAAVLAQVEAGEREQAAPSPPDWSVLFRGRPIRRFIARALVLWAKARVRDRENLRFERTRLFGHARRVFLAMGRELTAMGKLETPRDIFYLTVTEVLGAAEGFGLSTDLRSLAALRRSEDAAAELREDPPERITGRGAPISLVPAQRSSTKALDSVELNGKGCSVGKVEGVARMITDPLRQQLGPGEILVAGHTDPGWIALFANASAIVVERGSLLSHSAIVARELGIPCVVGAKGAMNWMEDGARIAVDGGSGQIRKLDV